MIARRRYYRIGHFGEHHPLGVTARAWFLLQHFGPRTVALEALAVVAVFALIGAGMVVL